MNTFPGPDFGPDSFPEIAAIEEAANSYISLLVKLNEQLKFDIQTDMDKDFAKLWVNMNMMLVHTIVQSLTNTLDIMTESFEALKEKLISDPEVDHSNGILRKIEHAISILELMKKDLLQENSSILIEN